MKNEKKKAGMALYAGGLCMFSVIILIVGMSLWAEAEGTKQEQIIEETGTTRAEENMDVLASVIEERAAMCEVEEEFANVRILTWDEYYALSPGYEKNSEQSGEETGVTENDIPMDEAGLRGLKELKRVFGDQMDGLYLMMTFLPADGENPMDTWMGYLCNYINEDTSFAEDERKSYSFEMNAVTGEMRKLSRSTGDLRQETHSNAVLTDEALMELAKDYVVQYRLEGNGTSKEGLTAEIYSGYESVRKSSPAEENMEEYPVNLILYSAEGTGIVQITVSHRSGSFIGYDYSVSGKNHEMIVMEDELQELREAEAAMMEAILKSKQVNGEE